MRTVKILLAVFVAVVIFNSCNKEYAEPKITWTPDRLSQLVEMDNEDTWNQTLNITFEAEAGIKEIKIWKNIYRNGQAGPTAELMEAPEGYEGLTSFDYTFATEHSLDDFTGGILKITYEFEVTDDSEDMQTTSREYAFFVWETNSVTFKITDGEENAIEDAKVTLGEEVKTAAPYVFFVVDGTYEYTIEKEGFQTITGEVVVDGEDVEKNITLSANLLSDWSEDIPLALDGQTGWATYNGTVIGTYKNETIGFAFTYTDEGIVRVTKTDNASGWVLVNEELTTTDALVDAYNNGTVISSYDLPYDQHKAYELRYFVSKVGDDYLLVKYVAGHRDTTTGNVVVFQYKN